MNSTKIKDLGKLFTTKGYNVVIGTTYTKQEEWLSYFRGDVNNVHHFTRKTMSGRRIDVYKPSLQMPKKVAEEWAGLILGEKVELITGNTESQKALDEVLLDNHFTDEITTFIELITGAYGTGAILEYVAEDEIKLNFIYGDKIMVIDYTNSTITAIAVIDEFVEDKLAYTHVMYHETDDGYYRITHEMYSTKESNRGLGKPCSLAIMFTEQEMKEMEHPIYDKENVLIGYEYYMEYKTEDAHFQVYKPPIVNNHDVKSPMGIAVTANALASFDGIDSKNYNLDREDSLTRTRIFVDDRVMEWSKVKDSDGNPTQRKYFDEDEDVYQIIKGMMDTETPVVTSNPTYNSMPRIEAIKLDLAFIGFRCGLGTDYFSFENGSVYVNEANVISSNSDTWRNREKYINRLKSVLVGMIKAILYLKDIKFDADKIDVQFDDSIITDNTAKLAQLRLDVQDGYAPEYMYLMEAYKISKEEALKMLEEAENQGGLVEPISPIVPSVEEIDDEEEDDEEID